MPHWERGYRSHGYWSDDSMVRYGRVGLTPPHSHPVIYTASIDTPMPDVSIGTFDKLKEAKKAVEEAVKQ